VSAHIAFLDCETTSLRHDRRAWEVGIIDRRPGHSDVEHSWFIELNDLDLGNADLRSLEVGRFHDRHPHARLDEEPDPFAALDETSVMMQVEAITRGAHIVGAVVNFDTEVLGNQMRQNGICPSWHYHLCDVENLAAGWLHRHAAVLENRAGAIDEATALREVARPPWDSHALSRAVGVEPDGFDRHTALGDAKWARAIFDAVTGGA
jgi:hypothetical protein